MIDHCPKAFRYTVTWDEDGTGPGSVIPHTTTYNRKTGIIWDAYSLTLTQRLRLIHVKDSDIKCVAYRFGDFADLRRALMPSEAVAAEKHGQQLQEAVKSGDAVQARQLIDQGADVNYQLDETGYQFPQGETTGIIPERSSPLVLAIGKNDEAMTRLLLEHGASVKPPDLSDSILNYTGYVPVAELLRLLL
ncbi:MAG: ankyrin repeat domain-containing protein [Pedobacter sp.]|nr:MAG: ankyrin repeat domain-containing protein [Pedobacter sp.]